LLDRQQQLLTLIENATGKAAYIGSVQEEGEDVEADPDTIEAENELAVLAGTAAIAGTASDLCAICETCNSIIP
jgi:hypothetical protein